FGCHVVDDPKTHSGTSPLKGETHFVDRFWLECSPSKKWSDRHGAAPAGNPSNTLFLAATCGKEQCQKPLAAACFSASWRRSSSILRRL
ncbi:MAG: hypothetical protein WBD33_24645, partial [Xanthobacteraceae bacterium]